MDKKLIHIAKCPPNQLFFLREEIPGEYCWFKKNGNEEIKTDVSASTIEEAMRLAHKTWKMDGFHTIICGFRYTLPERDEHGMNALFYELAASQNSMNGVYFDKEVGHNCFVQAASREALNLLDRLKKEKRI